jgi:hypothetical protein
MTEPRIFEEKHECYYQDNYVIIWKQGAGVEEGGFAWKYLSYYKRLWKKMVLWTNTKNSWQG